MKNYFMDMKKTVRKTALIAAAWAMTGCVTSMPADMTNTLKVGMDRDQVIDRLGQPVNSRESGENELMRFVMYDPFSGDKYQGKDTYYFVHLMEGEVYSFGRFGDFRQLDDLEKNSVARRIEELQPGMARFQVVDLLGEPHKAIQRGKVEYLNYIHVPRDYYRTIVVKGEPTAYYVKLNSRRVVDYGKLSELLNGGSDEK